MTDVKIAVPGAEARPAVQAVVAGFPTQHIVHFLAISLNHRGGDSLINHRVAHAHGRCTGNQPVRPYPQRCRHQVNVRAVFQVARQVIAVNCNARHIQHILSRMAQREPPEDGLGLDDVLQSLRAADKAFLHRRIRFGSAVAQISKRFAAVERNHLRISDRLAWISAAISGLFIE